MPDFIVWHVLIPIAPDAEVAALYTEAKQKLGQYLFQCKLEGDASALGMYLQTLLSWPSAPYREESCIHRKRLNRDSDEFLEIPVHTIPSLNEDKIYAKEQWLLNTLNEELSQGRGVAIFCRQTGTRDIQPRLEQVILKHVPLAKPFVLHGSVEAAKREAVLERQVEKGVNVLICNPILVQTGLDLVDFPSLIFFEPMYSLYVMGQASRRAWRLIQDKPCKTFYPFYADLMENQAVELVGRKTQAANLLYGNATGGGLSEIASGGGGNLLSELAKSIQDDTRVADLTALFARAAAAPIESAWLIPKPEPVVEVQPPTSAAVTTLVAASDYSDNPVIYALIQLGGVVTEVVNTAVVSPTRPMTNTKPRRKQARSLLDAPSGSLFSLPKPNNSRSRPIPLPSTTLPLFEPVQLALF